MTSSPSASTSASPQPPHDPKKRTSTGPCLAVSLREQDPARSPHSPDHAYLNSEKIHPCLRRRRESSRQSAWDADGGVIPRSTGTCHAYGCRHPAPVRAGCPRPQEKVPDGVECPRPGEGEAGRSPAPGTSTGTGATQRSVSSMEATNSRASWPSHCGSPSRSRTRAQAARASSRSPRSACRRASMHRAREAESRSSVSM